MDIFQQSALAWKELTEYRYQFVYGVVVAGLQGERSGSQLFMWIYEM